VSLIVATVSPEVFSTNVTFGDVYNIREAPCPANTPPAAQKNQPAQKIDFRNGILMLAGRLMVTSGRSQPDELLW